ncbi:MAG: helicase-related protein [Oscillospiraceae bacterium]
MACIHGRMKAKDKDACMAAFAAGETDILVSTTVIEVGVDVPNAALMIIENAERFGLSQLHQLRGRIGRGPFQSYCVLVSDAHTEEARARLKVLCDTADGFQIAEADLRQRGPGDFFGNRQHGLPALHIADLGTNMTAVNDGATRPAQCSPPTRRSPRPSTRRCAPSARGSSPPTTGILTDGQRRHPMTIAQILNKMIAASNGNIHDIDHLLRVWAYARTIGELEGLDAETQHLLEVAAITHDIACPLCREKYGNTNGKYQEQEGAVLVRAFLAGTGMTEAQIARVAYLVGHHHTLQNICGMDYQILIEADYIANASENGYGKESIVHFLDTIMKTASGKYLAASVLGISAADPGRTDC